MRRLTNKQLGKPIIDKCCFVVDDTQYNAPTEMIVDNEDYKEYARQNAEESFYLGTFDMTGDINVLVVVTNVGFDENPPYAGDSVHEYYFPNVGENRDLNYTYRQYTSKKGGKYSGEIVTINHEYYNEDVSHDAGYFDVVIDCEQIAEDDTGRRVRVYLVGGNYYA